MTQDEQARLNDAAFLAGINKLMLESAERELEHLRYMLRHVMYCATEVPDGELIAMVRYTRDERGKAEARVRELETRLRRYGIPLAGPLPPAEDE